MPISPQFNGQGFRAIDALAATPGEALTCALEAQVANNQQWLHVNGGGACARLAASSNHGIEGSNPFSALGARWVSLLYQPFLVTKGLVAIKVSFIGTVEDLNASMRLELLGFGREDAVWVLGTPANEQVYRSITLTLPEPSQYEYETDLILWTRSQMVSTSATSPGSGEITEGMVQSKTATMTTNPSRALVVTGLTWEGSGYPVRQVLEPLLRKPDGLDAGGGAAAVAILSEKYSGTGLRISETEVCRITPRSLFVKQVFA